MDNQLKMLKSDPNILAAIVGKLPVNIRTSHKIDYSDTEVPNLDYWAKRPSPYADVTKDKDDVITNTASTTVSAASQIQNPLITAEAA